MNDASSSAAQRLVLVTGPSGAGRSAAINAFEDMGYETIDSLPLSLISRLLGAPLERPLALGIAPATREFSLNAFIEVIDSLSDRAEIAQEVIKNASRTDVM